MASHDTRAGAGVELKEVLRTVACLVVLPLGLVAYRITGRTGAKVYQAFIWMFCVTGGRLNAALSWLITRLRPARPLPEAAGILGDLSGRAADDCVERLNRDGYVVFERALPPEACDRLREFARSTPSRVRRMDNESSAQPPRTALYDGGEATAVRYDYEPSDLLDNVDVQNLLADASLLRLAQAYLRCEPVADVLSMWWHTNYHTQPDSEAAQFYHFDMDRIKWFKVFIYLTDVGPDNGPHSFVVGSHRTGGIPWKLRRKGYVRLTDDEVIEQYGSDRCLHVTAPRGSIIVEDTRGLHKGNTVRGDPRLILQLQFSNSLFGGYYPPARVSRIQSAAFRSRLEALPQVYRQYV
jgi:ectoine hydroxylase-related dioxygenase (phytanoyl-CoA dioxygenase family)